MIHGVGPVALKRLMEKTFSATACDVQLRLCEMELTIRVIILNQIVAGINVVLDMDAINQLGIITVNEDTRVWQTMLCYMYA